MHICTPVEKQSASWGKKVQARALFMDFCQLGGSQWQTLQETIDSIDVGILSKYLAHASSRFV